MVDLESDSRGDWPLVGQMLACANQKGGVGKTTTVVNLAAYLAGDGRRVLVVDLDPQGNATSGLGAERAAAGSSVYDALMGGVDINELIVPTETPGLSLVPSSIALAGAEVELASVPQRERRLTRVIASVRSDFDDVFIDCPPSLGLLTVNALTAADAVLIPMQCEYYALEGLSQLIATIHLVRDHLNPALAVRGVVLTMFDARTNLSAEVAAEVREHLGESVFQTVVPRSVRLAEAPSYGRPIAAYAPDSRGAIAYRALATELRSRLDHEARGPNEAHEARGRDGARGDAALPPGASETRGTAPTITVPRPHLPVAQGAAVSGGPA
jgi:chromosome partitioning protein